MKYDQPVHLLWLGLAILFVAAALYLQHAGHKLEAEVKAHHHGPKNSYPPLPKEDDAHGHGH
jgi:hypothetical protein